MDNTSRLPNPSSSLTENILTLVDLLRRAGMPVSSNQVGDCLKAIRLVNIGQREQVFHAARCLLVSRYEHLRLFETIFNAFWRVQPANPPSSGQKAPRAPRHDGQEHQPVLISYMASKIHPTDPELDIADKSGTYSDIEILQRKDFLDMTPEELEAVKRLIRDMRWQACFRQTRRQIASRKGDNLHMRRVMASATRNGGTPIALTWQTPKIKQRPLILIADISGSMEKYSRLVLQFFYSVSHSLKDVECFVFGTRLTRITGQLKLKNIDRAVSEAAREVVDWAGGTRIGESLLIFNKQWSRRVLHRGAIVLIVSDGWELGDVETLRAQMRYLQLRSYRLIWLNPLMQKNDYEPLVEGMAAALPYIDDFMPIHNFQSLAALAQRLGTL